MAVLVLRRTRRDRRCIDARAAAGRSSAPPRPRNAGTPMRSSTYFSRALVRSVRSPWAMKARRMASQSCTASPGATITPVSRAKSPMAGDAAESEAEIDARRRRRSPSMHLTAESAMSLVSSSTATRAAAVEGDVEFARQAVQFAVVQDEMVQRAGIRAACRSVPAGRSRPSDCR